MPTNTYVAIDSTTLTSAVPSVTFSNLGSYTDIRVVVSTAVGAETSMQFNGNSTGSLYSATEMWAGTTTYSERATNLNYITLRNSSSTLGNNMSTVDIMNYSNSTTFKTVLISTNDNLYDRVYRRVGLWRNTDAITSITFYAGSGNLPVGSTFSLYGIKSWSAEVSPKATGGYIYEDSTYYYHAFPFSSTFTPSESITADILVVAGGGGGGFFEGGGGAGGLLTFSSQSLTATNYTCTVGAGGAGDTDVSGRASSGGSSQFGALTAAIGGGGGGSFDNNGNNDGGSGGSGGGGGGADDNAPVGTGGAGTFGQGNAGGNGSSRSTYHAGGGGGGAGAAGQSAANADTPGNGGIGATSALIQSIGTLSGYGHNFGGTYYLAGGGGGGANNQTLKILTNGGAGGGGAGGYGPTNVDGQSGMANTGGGGGGNANNNANSTQKSRGGSGLIVVRYAK